jgi:hypothetical protein
MLGFHRLCQLFRVDGMECQYSEYIHNILYTRSMHIGIHISLSFLTVRLPAVAYKERANQKLFVHLRFMDSITNNTYHMICILYSVFVVTKMI